MSRTGLEEISDLPGGEMSHKAVHFFWLLDTSASMSVSGKIAQLNFAIRESIPEMRKVADDNPTASVFVRAVTFSTGAQWHIEKPVGINNFTWTDVGAKGVTDFGGALDLVATQLESPPMPERALPPVLALVSDGQPTDNWKSALQRLDRTPWGRKTVRVAIAIGQDANLDVLKEFLGNPEFEPMKVYNAAQLAKAIRLASTQAIRTASQGREPTAADWARKGLIPTASQDDDDVW